MRTILAPQRTTSRNVRMLDEPVDLIPLLYFDISVQGSGCDRSRIFAPASSPQDEFLREPTSRTDSGWPPLQSTIQARPAKEGVEECVRGCEPWPSGYCRRRHRQSLPLFFTWPGLALSTHTHTRGSYPLKSWAWMAPTLSGTTVGPGRQSSSW